MIDKLLLGNFQFRESDFTPNIDHYRELAEPAPDGSLDRVFGFTAPDRPYHSGPGRGTFHPAEYWKYRSGP